MKSSQNTLAQNAFAESKKGKILSAIEWGLAYAIITFLMIYFSSKSLSEDPGFYRLLIVMPIILSLAGFALGGVSGRGIITLKLFPPSEDTIQAYQERQKQETEDRKQRRKKEIALAIENKKIDIKELEEELKNLS